MSLKATKPNNSFYNACILHDTGNRSMMEPGCDIKPECYDRLTIDECGNITAIDGRKVERRRLNLFFTYADEFSLAE